MNQQKESNNLLANLNDNSLVTIDVEVNFNKQALKLYFSFDNRKKLKSILDKNRYEKLQPLLTDETIIHNCLLYSVHYSLDKVSKKIIMNFYKDKEIDINKNNSEIFKFATYYKKTQLIPLLVEIGSDIHADEDYALIQFCLIGNIAIAKLLISKGANIYARNSLALIQAAANNRIDILALLLRTMKNTSIDYLSDYSATNYDLALIAAAHANNTEIVSMLLSAGANPKINDSEVLVIAAKNGNVGLVKIFLEYGLDPNVGNGIVLEKAVRNGHNAVVKELVDFQVNGIYQCNLSLDNSIALRWAVLKGNYDVVKLLLSAKINDKPRCDSTAENGDALRLAKKYGHDEIVKLLSDPGSLNKK
jgi:ankyrin repeat protein